MSSIAAPAPRCSELSPCFLLDLHSAPPALWQSTFARAVLRASQPVLPPPFCLVREGQGFSAWTSSPTKSRDFFMVCLLSEGSFIGDIASGSPRDLRPLVPYAAASAMIPRVRLCTVRPRNPRRSLSCKVTALLFQTRCAPRKGSHKV
jgi:hypothetical protein